MEIAVRRTRNVRRSFFIYLYSKSYIAPVVVAPVYCGMRNVPAAIVAFANVVVDWTVEVEVQENAFVNNKGAVP